MRATDVPPVVDVAPRAGGDRPRLVGPCLELDRVDLPLGQVEPDLMDLEVPALRAQGGHLGAQRRRAVIRLDHAAGDLRRRRCLQGPAGQAVGEVAVGQHLRPEAGRHRLPSVQGGGEIAILGGDELAPLLPQRRDKLVA